MPVTKQHTITHETLQTQSHSQTALDSLVSASCSSQQQEQHASVVDSDSCTHSPHELAVAGARGQLSRETRERRNLREALDQKIPFQDNFFMAAEGFIGLPMASASVARAAPHRPLLTRAANPQ